MRNKPIIVGVMTLTMAVIAASVEQTVQILKNSYEATEGGYNFEYELSDGQRRNEGAETRYDSNQEPILAVHGSYSYVGPDGITYTVDYTADENGFKPSGAHLPDNVQTQPPGAGAAFAPPPPLGISQNALLSLAG